MTYREKGETNKFHPFFILVKKGLTFSYICRKIKTIWKHSVTRSAHGFEAPEVLVQFQLFPQM